MSFRPGRRLPGMDLREDLTGGVRPATRAQQREVVVQLCGPILPTEAGRLCAQVRALLSADCTRDVVCDVQGMPDLSVVDALARLQLTARRFDRRVRVRSAGPDLRGLLALTGLQLAVPGLLSPGGSELGGQPEAGEQRGVEEVVHVHDLPG